MKKSYRIQDLDCPHCAAKIENAIGKIDGVESARLSFLTRRLTISAAEDQFDAILREAVRIAKRLEPDCAIIC